MFFQGLYQKAEALYSMGDFEYALMYYHRGHKLRPELDEFRLGIQKAQEAIDNSIGSMSVVFIFCTLVKKVVTSNCKINRKLIIKWLHLVPLPGDEVM